MSVSVCSYLPDFAQIPSAFERLSITISQVKYFLYLKSFFFFFTYLPTSVRMNHFLLLLLVYSVNNSLYFIDSMKLFRKQIQHLFSTPVKQAHHRGKMKTLMFITFKKCEVSHFINFYFHILEHFNKSNIRLYVIISLV